ncbi:MAG: PorP/SprF family type IX secretion system membrane protein [Prevotellaceae bacterium]|jgi:type IX secretion system PorP/SprF family membrane protein|nr:PorP/SprF family type IX secretion system membrane protein [Prevotellaceae bacterium]
MHRVRILLINFLLIGNISMAQSDFDLSQRFFNEALYNPAATGNTFTTSVYMHARAQWVGLEGAPTTEAISTDYFIPDFNSAVGLTVTGDQIGFTNSYSGRLSYAYYIPIFDKSLISFGLSMSILNRNQNASNALVDDLVDGELYYADISESKPDFDFGIEYKGPVKLGAAIRHFGPKLSSPYFKSYSMNIWSYASVKLNLSNNTTIEPMLSHVYRDRFNRLEAGAVLYFKKNNFKSAHNEKFWIGGMWRFHGQFACLAGVWLMPNLRVGYSLDYAVGELARISEFGTHEIFISWHINPSSYKDEICPAYKDPSFKAKNRRKFIRSIKDVFGIY